MATDDAPAAVTASFTSAATSAMAAFQVTLSKFSVSRMSGVSKRSPLFTASKLNRPRSHSQPWFTGSLSTPMTRTSWSRVLCTTVRQPTAQVVQVLSCCERSQGRALKRYG